MKSSISFISLVAILAASVCAFAATVIEDRGTANNGEIMPIHGSSNTFETDLYAIDGTSSATIAISCDSSFKYRDVKLVSNGAPLAAPTVISQDVSADIKIGAFKEIGESTARAATLVFCDGADSAILSLDINYKVTKKPDQIVYFALGDKQGTEKSVTLPFIGFKMDASQVESSGYGFAIDGSKLTVTTKNDITDEASARFDILASGDIAVNGVHIAHDHGKPVGHITVAVADNERGGGSCDAGASIFAIAAAALALRKRK